MKGRRLARLLGVKRQVKPRLLDVVVVEVELGDYYFVEALELGAVREVGPLLLLFLGFLLGFLGFLLGFRRFLVVGPTRARSRRDIVSRTRRRASP